MWLKMLSGNTLSIQIHLMMLTHKLITNSNGHYSSCTYLRWIMDFVCLSFVFLNGFTAVETETFIIYFAEAARLQLQNFLFVITVI